MGKYLETEYLGDGSQGFKTLVGAAFETDGEAIAAFESAKWAGGDIKTAPFILDLREDNGDIIDTCGISAETYTEITGEPVLSADEYKEIDAKYWQAAKGLWAQLKAKRKRN